MIFDVLELSLCRPYIWLYARQFLPLRPIFAMLLLRYRFKCLYMRHVILEKSKLQASTVFRVGFRVIQPNFVATD